MAHWKELFSGSEYLTGPDFKGKTFTGRIASVESIGMEDDSGKRKSIPLVHFDIKGQKPWLMCKTTGYCVAAMFGDDYNGWVGKRVTLYATMVQVGKGKELGVRVQGSPDLPAPINVEIKMPRKKPVTVKLVPTGKAAAPKPAPAPPPPEADEMPPPEEDSAQGEHIPF